MTEKATGALAVQVGGDHYKNLAIQPIEYIHANNMPFIDGSVVKYITRWRDKGGIKDLEKIKHFVDLLIELEGKAAPVEAVPAPAENVRRVGPWVQWSGGVCPVGAHCGVEVQLRSGSTLTGLAGDVRWWHSDAHTETYPGDIILYRATNYT